jgi:glycerate dehydrogenase
MNIVVLDGYSLNPGDLSWTELEKLGSCVIYDRTAPEDVIKRSRNADIIITNKARFPAEIIEKLPRLKYIGVTATGYNIIDINAARRHDIIVTNVPAYSTLSVAQLVFAHILNLCHHVSRHSHAVKSGKWASSPDFCFWDYCLIELAGLTLGIIGMGQIGQAVARIGREFGMNIIYHTHRQPAQIPTEYQSMDIATIFRESDIVSLHCPLTPATEKMVNTERLSLMKPTAFLINTSRGRVIDEPALADALNSGKIAGAGLDVLSCEPPKPNNPLLTAENCYITPHIAWATQAARQRLMNVVIKNVHAFLECKPTNVVNNLK